MEEVTYPSLLGYLQVLLEEVTHIYRNGGSDLPLSVELSALYFLKRSPTSTGMEEVTYPSLLGYL